MCAACASWQVQPARFQSKHHSNQGSLHQQVHCQTQHRQFQSSVSLFLETAHGGTTCLIKVGSMRNRPGLSRLSIILCNTHQVWNMHVISAASWNLMGVLRIWKCFLRIPKIRSMSFRMDARRSPHAFSASTGKECFEIMHLRLW